MFQRCVAWTLLLSVAVAQTAATPPEEELKKSLRSVKSLLTEGKYRGATDALAAFLASVGEHEAIRAKSAEITELMERAVFGVQYPPPDPKTLVSGDLQAWTPSSGRIKIRYTPDRMSDFGKEDGEQHIHPMIFSGPYSITLKGKSYPATGEGVQVLVGIEKNDAYVVAFGRVRVTEGSQVSWVPALLRHVTGESKEDLDVKDASPSSPGKLFTVKVTVEGTNIQGSYGGRVVLSGKKKRAIWGQAGFAPDGPFEEAVFEGTIEPAWIQAQVDAATSGQREEFRHGYKPADHLPAWLFQVPKPVGLSKPAGPLAHSKGGLWPESVSRSQDRGLETIHQLYRHEEFERGMTLTVKLKDADAPALVKDYLLGLFQCALGAYDDAEAKARLIVEKAPEFAGGYLLQASILRGRVKGAESLKLLEDLVERWPGDDEIHIAAAMATMEVNNVERAREIADRALSLGLKSDELLALRRTIEKARTGPSYARRFEFQSTNYVVVSDIDRKTCEEAARVLEQAYAAFKINLETVNDVEKRKFQVYLFAGQDGYDTYCKDLRGATVPSSAGVYMPDLRQLLIWNLPRREEMMRTVRHEGFHQYLDRLMDDPPLWFNEGLAEYYEQAAASGGAAKVGAIRQDHVETLREGCKPLREFLYQPSYTFMGHAQRNYAQAWAFIHFLRHSTPKNKKIFDRFWKAFKESTSSYAGITKALEGIDIEVLGGDFRAYVFELK